MYVVKAKPLSNCCCFSSSLGSNNRIIPNSIKYDCLDMTKYLQEDKLQYSFKEKRNIFQCRNNDINVKAIRSWKYYDLNCMACNEPNQIETQMHVLCCKPLINRNLKVSYIPVYNVCLVICCVKNLN